MGDLAVDRDRVVERLVTFDVLLDRNRFPVLKPEAGYRRRELLVVGTMTVPEAPAASRGLMMSG